MLYTWQCCSRAIQQPKSNEQLNRAEIYGKTVEVLAPEVSKLLYFMHFQCRPVLESCGRFTHPAGVAEFIHVSCYTEQNSRHGFVGPCHMHHMCRLLGYQDIAVVMEELLKIVKLLIPGNLLQFTKTLMEAIPKTCKLPRYDHGSPGVRGYYHAQLNDIKQYPDARTELFHNFREFGNTILFCLLMEQAPVRKVRSKGEKPEVKLRKLEAKFDSLHAVAHVEKLGSAKQTMIAKEGDLLTRERLCCGLSIFEIVLSGPRGFLDDSIWVGVPPTNGVMNNDECTELHRL
ncbi:unnamed protein product [Bemisia tabaci]|nr:unnamed protein product [Bemisia tabaci]